MTEERVPGRARSEQGSGTVLVLGIVGVLLTLLVALATVGAAVVGRHRAQSAADLAALAAAEQLRDGGQVCAAAAASAASNGATLVTCRVGPVSGADPPPGRPGAPDAPLEGASEVLVDVSVPVPVPGLPPALGRSRAGLVPLRG